MAEVGSAALETAATVHPELGPGLLEIVYTFNSDEAVMKTGITRCVNGL